MKIRVYPCPRRNENGGLSKSMKRFFRETFRSTMLRVEVRMFSVLQMCDILFFLEGFWRARIVRIVRVSTEAYSV